jgi:hypothetical protein
MDKIWEILKRAYEDLYDLPHFYLGIKDETYCHIFSAVFILILILGIALTIKTRIEIYYIRKERRASQRRIEKLLIMSLDNKKTKTKKT